MLTVFHGLFSLVSIQDRQAKENSTDIVFYQGKKEYGVNPEEIPNLCLYFIRKLSQGEEIHLWAIGKSKKGKMFNFSYLHFHMKTLNRRLLAWVIISGILTRWSSPWDTWPSQITFAPQDGLHWWGRRTKRNQ